MEGEEKEEGGRGEARGRADRGGGGGGAAIACAPPESVAARIGCARSGRPARRRWRTARRDMSQWAVDEDGEGGSRGEKGERGGRGERERKGKKGREGKRKEGREREKEQKEEGGERPWPRRSVSAHRATRRRRSARRCRGATLRRVVHEVNRRRRWPSASTPATVQTG